MPRIFGHNLLFFILAGLAFYIFGFLMYGVIFGEYWMEISNVPEGFSPPAWKMVLGLIVPFLPTAGIALLADKLGKSDLAGYVKLAALLAIAFAIAAMAYGYAYGPAYNVRMFAMDGLHMVIGFAIAGAVLSFGRAK